jgi:prepilin-type processing-associated H-X9-DG protein/prepilin-type N-terminal cleavage/methylation domain-containing protein
MDVYDSYKPEPGGHAPGSPGLGFTLVELLVVIAILGLLAALIFPSARGALQKAAMIDCMSDVRQMGIAVHMFAGDQNGLLPGTSHNISWTNTLAAYLGENFIGRCPAVPHHRARVTYGWNDCLASASGIGMSIDACSAPASTMVIAELATNQSSEHFHFAGVRGGPGRVTPNQFRASVNVEAHGSKANYLFVDGHVETVTWSDINIRLTQPNSNLIIP